MARDNFTAGVKRVLAERAGFQCSRPSCRAVTYGPADDEGRSINVGVAAHITAASPGGARYDPSISSELRKSASNGIWLCETHGKEIDHDTTQYTTELIRAWKEHSEHEARALLGRPVTGREFEVRAELSLQRTDTDALNIVGGTNLPSGTKLMSSLEGTDYEGSGRATVHQGFFMSGPFSKSAGLLVQDWYTARVFAYFNGPWQQPAHVQKLLGKDGDSLAGRFAVAVDPDLEESKHIFEAKFECLAPAPRDAKPLTQTELQDAIATLQRKVLHPQGFGEPSSSPVGEAIEIYMGFPGLSEREGWEATEPVAGMVEVVFSYWDGDIPAEAVWHVLPSSGAVRYRNWSAKKFSWTQD